MLETPEIPFQSVLNALLDLETPFPPRLLYRLSDLNALDVAQLQETWAQLPQWRRLAMMEDLEELGSADTMLSFEAIGRFAVEDEDPLVRQLAVQVLWEFEAADLVPLFLKLLERDAGEKVRAAAATALGRFVYLGEIDELPKEKQNAIEERLLAVIRDDRVELVRRRALESIGYSGRAEVPPLIEAAFTSDDREWVAASLLAMGRSADDRWEGSVLSMLDDRQPSLRAEAARATGELEIFEATPQLIELIDDGNEEVRSAAVWSLSQIGGEGVREALESLLAKTEEDSELDFIETALDNLAFTEGQQPFSLLDLPKEDYEAAMLDILDDEDDLLDFEEEDDSGFLYIDDDEEEDEEFSD
jgi:HEAT repeat protein